MSTAQIQTHGLDALFGSATEYDRATLVEQMRMLDEPLCLHAELVAVAAGFIADRLDLDVEGRAVLINAAWLHDIGKLTISRSVLDKPSTLDAREWTEMQQHAARGADYLASMRPPGRLAEFVRHHHERFDGGGYPFGLAADAIPLGARIICLVDAYDAMITERPYRRAMTADAALEEVRRCTGTQFDPALVEIFVSIVPLLQKGSVA